MFDKLSLIEERYEELSQKVSDPSIIADSQNFAKLCKEQSDIAPIVEKYREYKQAKETIRDGEEILADADMDKEMKELAEEEIKERVFISKYETWNLDLSEEELIQYYIDNDIRPANAPAGSGEMF